MAAPVPLSLPVPPSPAPRSVPGAPWRPEVPVHRAEDLTGAAGQARIALSDQLYTLRITRAGKLILTK